MGKSLFGDSLSLLLSSEADIEVVCVPEALRTVHVNAQSVDGTKQSNGWICLFPEQRLQVHHLIPKGCIGNFGHISRLGSKEKGDPSSEQFIYDDARNGRSVVRMDQ